MILVEEPLFQYAGAAYRRINPFAMHRTKDILNMKRLHSACRRRSNKNNENNK